MLRSALVGLVCCSVMAPVVRAQPPSPERASRIEETRRQLRSDDAQTVAWGAFHTGTYRLIELAPAGAFTEVRQPFNPCRRKLA